MNIIIRDTAREAQTFVAERIMAVLKARPSPALGLATGATMRPVYEALVDAYRLGHVSFKSATTFNLDEYYPLPPDHPDSYRAFMRSALFDRVDIDPSKTHVPLGDRADPIEEAHRYESLIRAAGGLDLQVLGLGMNGHIGFNEPGSSPWSRTRLVTLEPETREANAGYFQALRTTPERAITMGIATIMDARHCLLLATGSRKAAIVKRMIEGPIHPDCPASFLQRHPATTVVLDRAAAADLHEKGAARTQPVEGEGRHAR